MSRVARRSAGETDTRGGAAKGTGEMDHRSFSLYLARFCQVARHEVAAELHASCDRGSLRKLHAGTRRRSFAGDPAAADRIKIGACIIPSR